MSHTPEYDKAFNGTAMHMSHFYKLYRSDAVL